MAQVKRVAEKDIQHTILQYLKLKGYFCWKSNNVGIYIKAKDRYMKSPMPGLSDIIGLNKQGRFFAIEVKAGYNKPSPDQLKFIDNVKACNGVGLVAYNLDDVIKAGL